MRRSVPSPPDDDRQLLRLVVAAAVVALALVAATVVAARTGVLPARLTAANADVAPPPPTRNPETTAAGSEPILAVRCRFVGTAGAACVLQLADVSGNLVDDALAIPVPRTWLARFPAADRPDDMAVVGALIHTHFAPPDGPGMRTLAVSVSPSFARLLGQVGVTPRQLLAWLYQNVPLRQRPPWAGGPMP